MLCRYDFMKVSNMYKHLTLIIEQNLLSDTTVFYQLSEWWRGKPLRRCQCVQVQVELVGLQLPVISEVTQFCLAAAQEVVSSSSGLFRVFGMGWTVGKNAVTLCCHLESVVSLQRRGRSLTAFSLEWFHIRLGSILVSWMICVYFNELFFFYFLDSFRDFVNGRKTPQ